MVDDGSKDGTWDLIEVLCSKEELFIGIKLSKNKGHQNALLAGMMYAKNKCDCVITMDADLQDDIEVIPQFIDEYNKGCHIVYGIRKSRNRDAFFKRMSARLFYGFMNRLGIETIYDHADYRLMSKKALCELETFHEVNLFLRGIIPLIGLKAGNVYYDRKERQAGKTKYTFKKMLGLALDGITSFSVRPLRMISAIGILCSALSISGILYALISYFCGIAVPGWTAIVCSIWLLGGINLLCTGMLGAYIGKIFSEVKGRPRFIIEKIVESDKEFDE